MWESTYYNPDTDGPFGFTYHTLRNTGLRIELVDIARKPAFDNWMAGGDFSFRHGAWGNGELKNTADIVVIGGGPAGVATALEASKNGASVLLLEADTLIGGNAARSTGYLAFQGFAMQDKAGFEDSAEIFYADMVEEINRQKENYGIEFDAELAKVFAQESASTYDWLIDLGFEFNRFLPRPLQHSVNRMVDVTDTSMFTKVFSDSLKKTMLIFEHPPGQEGY